MSHTSRIYFGWYHPDFVVELHDVFWCDYTINIEEIKEIKF